MLCARILSGPSGGGSARLLRHVLCVLLSATLVLVQTAASAHSVLIRRAQLPPHAGDLVASAPEALDFVRALRTTIDRSRFDLQALLDRLQYDEQQIIEWVKERITFEPYSGVLRGAKGTLISGAGNSADQSLLLATLLKDAGFETRIVQGTISPVEAELLQEEIFRGRQWQKGPPLDVEQARTVLARWAQRVGIPAEEAEAGLERTFAREAPPPEPAFAAEVPSTVAALADAAAPHLPPQRPIEWPPRHYFWVEYRLAPGADWQSVHPSLGGPPGPAFGPEPVEYHAEQIPAEFLQTFRLEAFAQRKIGVSVETVPIMEVWERPTANLYGELVRFDLVPDTALDADVLDNPGALAEWTYLVPLLNGNLPPGAIAVDRHGLTAPGDVITQPQAGIVKQFAAKGTKGIEALSGLGTSEEQSPALSLGQIVLQYTIEAPDRTRTARRVIFDPSEDAAQGARAITPMRAESLVLNSGAYSPAFTADATLARLQEGLEMLAATRPVEAGFEVPIEAVPVPSASEQLSLYTLFRSGAARIPNAVVYRPVPGLVAISSSVKADSQSPAERTVVDVVFNERHALVPGAAGPMQDTRAALHMGAWDSYAEGAHLARLSTEVETWSAAEELEAGRTEGFTVISSVEQVAELLPDLERTTREAMAADVAEGYVLLVPSDAGAGTSKVAWWRISAETGTALAIGPSGRGVTATEFQLTLSIIVGFVIVQAIKIFVGTQIIKWEDAQKGISEGLEGPNPEPQR